MQRRCVRRPGGDPQAVGEAVAAEDGLLTAGGGWGRGTEGHGGCSFYRRHEQGFPFGATILVVCARVGHVASIEARSADAQGAGDVRGFHPGSNGRLLGAAHPVPRVWAGLREYGPAMGLAGWASRLARECSWAVRSREVQRGAAGPARALAM